MTQGKRPGAVREAILPPPERVVERGSEKRVKAAPRWSPTLPSVAMPVEPDPLAEAHEAANEARAALAALVLCLDRISTRRRR